MDKKYISVDVETSGPTPGKYSMLSIGACVIAEEKRFYCELKPISRNYLLEAMRISSKGLHCLKEYNSPEYDPAQETAFNPKLVLNVLQGAGTEPAKVMKDFNDWIADSTAGFQPTLVANPVLFDGMFISWYFDNFLGHNPFGYGGWDIGSLYRGVTGNLKGSIKDLNLRSADGLNHNALDDALQQAREFEEILRMMRK